MKLYRIKCLTKVTQRDPKLVIWCWQSFTLRLSAGGRCFCGSDKMNGFGQWRRFEWWIPKYLLPFWMNSTALSSSYMIHSQPITNSKSARFNKEAIVPRSTSRLVTYRFKSNHENIEDDPIWDRETSLQLVSFAIEWFISFGRLESDGADWSRLKPNGADWSRMEPTEAELNHFNPNRIESILVEEQRRSSRWIIESEREHSRTREMKI